MYIIIRANPHTRIIVLSCAQGGWVGRGGNIFKPNAPCLSLTGRRLCCCFSSPLFPCTRDQRPGFGGRDGRCRADTLYRVVCACASCILYMCRDKKKNATDREGYVRRRIEDGNIVSHRTRPCRCARINRERARRDLPHAHTRTRGKRRGVYINGPLPAGPSVTKTKGFHGRGDRWNVFSLNPNLHASYVLIGLIECSNCFKYIFFYISINIHFSTYVILIASEILFVNFIFIF